MLSAASLCCAGGGLQCEYKYVARLGPASSSAEAGDPRHDLHLPALQVAGHAAHTNNGLIHFIFKF